MIETCELPKNLGVRLCNFGFKSLYQINKNISWNTHVILALWPLFILFSWWIFFIDRWNQIKAGLKKNIFCLWSASIHKRLTFCDVITKNGEYKVQILSVISEPNIYQDIFLFFIKLQVAD